VIYRDYVVLVTTRIGKTTDSDSLLGGAPPNSVPGILGHEQGDWADGEKTLDISSNPYGLSYPDLIEQNPLYKRVIFLDRITGVEVAFDIDSDGIMDGAPVSWTGDAGSIGYPVVSGYDDVIYIRSSPSHRRQGVHRLETIWLESYSVSAYIQKWWSKLFFIRQPSVFPAETNFWNCDDNS
jgi:hypothetical protein